MVRSSDVFDMPTARLVVILFRQHPLNPRHIVVTNRIGFSVIPIDGNFTPRRSDNRALIGGGCGPADSITCFEKSGLFAGHLRFTYTFDPLHVAVARQTLMAVFPVDGDVSRLNRLDLAGICRVIIEAHASADLKIFGLFRGHFDLTRPARAK
jgi:hypothetical protein